jgi:MFS-type transporter involved in bile tolerance (Atg22 family)
MANQQNPTVLERIRQNWQMLVAIVAGAAVVFVVGITTESTTAIMVTGMAVGILVGGLIAAQSGKAEEKKRRR